MLAIGYAPIGFLKKHSAIAYYASRRRIVALLYPVCL
jgi:hypothetical protein